MSEHDSEDTYCGTGGPRPHIGDPTYSSILLYAYESTNGIRVSWTYTVDFPWSVASITVYRSTASTFNSAVQAIWTGMSSNYLDTPEDLQTQTRYYYWIKLTSVNGTETAIVGPANAMMKTATELTVQNLYDSITETELYSDLTTEIGRISDFETSLNLQDTKFEQINAVIGDILDGFEADLLANGTALLDTKLELQTADYNAVLALEGIAAQYDANFAGILTEQIVYADATSAVAQKTETLEASVFPPGGPSLSALVQTNSEVTADLAEGVRANWTVKVNATNQYGTSIAGIGLEVTDAADADVAPTSTFIVTADKFAILESGNDPDAPVIPFAVGQVTDPATGVTQSTVVITKAMIEDASIETLRIAGQAITVPSFTSFANPGGPLAAGSSIGTYSSTTHYPIYTGNLNSLAKESFGALPSTDPNNTKRIVYTATGSPSVRGRRYNKTSSGWVYYDSPTPLWTTVAFPKGGTAVVTFNCQTFSIVNDDNQTGWIKFKITCRRVTNVFTTPWTTLQVPSPAYKQYYINTTGGSSTQAHIPISFSQAFEDTWGDSAFIIYIEASANKIRVTDASTTVITAMR